MVELRLELSVSGVFVLGGGACARVCTWDCVCGGQRRMFGALLSHSLSYSLEREALAELLDEKLAWEPANPSSPPLSAPLSTGIVNV